MHGRTSGGRRQPSSKALLIIASVAIGIILLLLLFWDDILSLLLTRHLLYDSNFFFATNSEFIRNSFRQAASQIFRSALLLCLFIIVVRLRHDTLRRILLISLIFIDLYSFGAKYLPLHDPEASAVEPAIITAIQAQPGAFRVFCPAAPPNHGMADTLKDIFGIESLVLADYAEFIAYVDSNGDGTPPIRAVPRITVLSPLYKYMCLKYVVMPD